jgi:hypothetical protein
MWPHSAAAAPAPAPRKEQPSSMPRRETRGAVDSPSTHEKASRAADGRFQHLLNSPPRMKVLLRLQDSWGGRQLLIAFCAVLTSTCSRQALARPYKK